MSVLREGQARVLELQGLDLDSRGGRPLIRDLSLRVDEGDRVALIGRNGVGKSTLLGLLANEGEVAERGRIQRWGRSCYLPQHPSFDAAQRSAAALANQVAASSTLGRAIGSELEQLGLRALDQLLASRGLSRGEQRKLALLAAKRGTASLLLLDEPTEDLDTAGIDWLVDWLPRWSGALIVASHSPRLLRHFEHFFVLAESGCRYYEGDYDQLSHEFEREAKQQERRHVQRLNALEQRERHHVAICRRRQRKKNLGRMHELKRRTSRARLNEKRSYAQQSQARAAKIRADRIGATRDWARATRRALRVDLPLEALTSELPRDDGRPLIQLEHVGVEFDGRALFEGVSLVLGRQRLAITGPNGCGKTSLLATMLGELRPTSGRATRERKRLASIAQGGQDWVRDESLIEQLCLEAGTGDPEQIASWLVAHRFPLALAERPLASLSPGERVRAALICLFHRSPAVELLVLDEPSFSLDLVGLAALQLTLRAWPGGLVVASHDHEFLAALRMDEHLVLGGPHPSRSVQKGALDTSGGGDHFDLEP